MARLRLLNLDGSPPAATMGEVTRVWAETIAATFSNADPHIDGPRLHEAFLYLVQTQERWPVPRHVLKAMPPRPAPLALPEPTISAEKRAQARARLADLRATFSQPLEKGKK